MVDWEFTPEGTREQIAAIGTADAVVGLTDCGDGAALARAVEAIRAVQAAGGGSSRTVVLYPETAGEPAQAGSVTLVPLPEWRPEHTPGGVNIEPQSVLAMAAISRALGAGACCIWSSAAERMTSAALGHFLRAAGGGGFELAVPSYTQPRFGSLINSAIVAPLTRAVYGQRIPFPMAQDLCLSSRMVDELLRPESKTGRPRPPQWIPAQAVCLGFRLCSVELGWPAPTMAGSGELSAVLSTVLGSLFQHVEQNASFWQRTRASQPLERFGDPARAEEEDAGFDAQRMIEGYRLAYRNLGEIWGLVLPPATMLELKRLTRAPAAEFRLADVVWARVVYDFLIAQRQRVMSREHLLRALTPIYLAWVASYANEVGPLPAGRAAHRLEQLGQAYEAQKPYLLARWRWPDRFNP